MKTIDYTPEAIPQLRRFDVDWLRIIAMGLLIIYHVVISFQPWAKDIGFPQNNPTLIEIWILMAIINVWRIPILFMISGMGVRFAIEHRDWKELLKDRAIRILIPWIFGIYLLEYLVTTLLAYLGWNAKFTITFGHLWFLLNIFLYTVGPIGILIYWKNKPDNGFFRFLSKVFRWRYGLFLLALPVMLEAWLVNPKYFSTYVDTVHGWILGLICFTAGFIFISLKDVFWPSVKRIRWSALSMAFSLYLVRLFIYKLQGAPIWLVGLESASWMLAIFGFSALYLNKSSRGLSYFSKAVYPVYIVHMPVQFIVAYYLLSQPLSALTKLIILLAGTFGISLFLYEFVLKRIKWFRPLFGMKLN